MKEGAGERLGAAAWVVERTYSLGFALTIRVFHEFCEEHPVSRRMAFVRFWRVRMGSPK